MRSDAQKKADKKYIKSGKCQYKTISARLHNEQAECIQKAAENIGVTQSKFILLSALHCIKNNIKFSNNDIISKQCFDINSDLIAVSNKGYAVKNTENFDILEVSNDEFKAVKNFIENYRKNQSHESL